MGRYHSGRSVSLGPRFHMTKGRPRLRPRTPHPIAEQLRVIRIAKRKSMEQIGRKLKCLPDTLGRWERGEMLPTLENLSDWCATLGYELSLRQSAKDVLAENIPFPTTKQLMARR
jgi:transcriptional regulator with XRE-family HTH domain